MVTETVLQLVNGVRHRTEDTARNWTALGEDEALAAMDGEFVRCLTENHLDGLACDAMILLGWETRMSPYTVALLKRRAALYEAVYEAHYDALVELNREVPEIVRAAMLPKGAFLATLYGSLRHRRMTDFDLCVPPEMLPDLVQVLDKLGYEEKLGGFGRDMVKVVGPVWSWRDKITMHVFPIKAVAAEHSVEWTLRDVACRAPSPEQHAVTMLANAQEHLSSYCFATFGSDLQYIRVIDIELLVDTFGTTGEALWHTAGAMGLQAEVALGLWCQEQLRGSLPAAWNVLAPAVRAVADLGDLVALPGGPVLRWEISAAQRVFHPNRTALALDLLPADRRTPSYRADLRRSLVQDTEPVEEILEEARARLRGVASELP